MVKQQKKNNRKKQSSKGFTANSTKARKIDASTEQATNSSAPFFQEQLSNYFLIKLFYAIRKKL
jgi:hypothetical protein